MQTSCPILNPQLQDSSIVKLTKIHGDKFEAYNKEQTLRDLRNLLHSLCIHHSTDVTIAELCRPPSCKHLAALFMNT